MKLAIQYDGHNMDQICVNFGIRPRSIYVNLADKDVVYCKEKIRVGDWIVAYASSVEDAEHWKAIGELSIKILDGELVKNILAQPKPNEILAVTEDQMDRLCRSNVGC